MLENKKISKIRYFAKGKRGLLFKGVYKRKKVAIKAKNPKSGALGRIENEVNWLKRLNMRKIGPKLLFSDEGYFVCEFIEGDFIMDYIGKSNKGKIKKALKGILNQLLMLDELKIDKEEMHHPVKHVIVSKNRPYLIDFERCHYSQHPKNITQFCQFLMNIEDMLKHAGILIKKPEIIELAKVYKNNPNKGNFRKISDLI
jgi:putative serine/threonine protein kinase